VVKIQKSRIDRDPIAKTFVISRKLREKTVARSRSKAGATEKYRVIEGHFPLRGVKGVKDGMKLLLVCRTIKITRYVVREDGPDSQQADRCFLSLTAGYQQHHVVTSGILIGRSPRRRRQGIAKYDACEECVEFTQEDHQSCEGKVFNGRPLKEGFGEGDGEEIE